MITKNKMLERMLEWNGLIDEYIAQHLHDDKFMRTALEIEVDAKIAAHGGPLYRHCEAEGCDQAEKRDVPKLQACAGCKLVRASQSIAVLMLMLRRFTTVVRTAR